MFHDGNAEPTFSYIASPVRWLLDESGVGDGNGDQSRRQHGGQSGHCIYRGVPRIGRPGREIPTHPIGWLFVLGENPHLTSP